MNNYTVQIGDVLVQYRVVPRPAHLHKGKMLYAELVGHLISTTKDDVVLQVSDHTRVAQRIRLSNAGRWYPELRGYYIRSRRIQKGAKAGYVWLDREQSSSGSKRVGPRPKQRRERAGG